MRTDAHKDVRAGVRDVRTSVNERARARTSAHVMCARPCALVRTSHTVAHSRAQSRTLTGVSRRLKLRRLALYSRVLTDLSSETKPTFFSNEELIKYLASEKEGHYSDINPRGRQPLGTDPLGVTYVRI